MMVFVEVAVPYAIIFELTKLTELKVAEFNLIYESIESKFVKKYKACVEMCRDDYYYMEYIYDDVFNQTVGDDGLTTVHCNLSKLAERMKYITDSTPDIIETGLRELLKSELKKRKLI